MLLGKIGKDKEIKTVTALEKCGSNGQQEYIFRTMKKVIETGCEG